MTMTIMYVDMSSAGVGKVSCGPWMTHTQW